MTSPVRHMRIGDHLPTISCQVLDAKGVLVQIPAGSRVYVLIRPKFSPAPSIILVAETVNDVVSYDWQDADTAKLEIGTYDFAVDIVFPDGHHIVAPTDHHCELIVGDRLDRVV